MLDRFFGKGTPRPGGPPVANPRLTDPVGLQCLFDIPLDLPADGLQVAVRDYHPELAQATVELYSVPPCGKHGDLEPSIMGLVAWERHVIKLVAFPTPMPADAVRACVQPAHFDPQFKEIAYRHQTHVMLYYAGYETDPLEQYVALAAVAGVLVMFGAVFTLNENARTAVPAPVLMPHEEDEGNMLAALRGPPVRPVHVRAVRQRAGVPAHLRAPVRPGAHDAGGRRPVPEVAVAHHRGVVPRQRGRNAGGRARELAAPGFASWAGGASRRRGRLRRDTIPPASHV